MLSKFDSHDKTHQKMNKALVFIHLYSLQFGSMVSFRAQIIEIDPFIQGCRILISVGNLAIESPSHDDKSVHSNPHEFGKKSIYLVFSKKFPAP